MPATHAMSPDCRPRARYLVHFLAVNSGGLQYILYASNPYHEPRLQTAGKVPGTFSCCKFRRSAVYMDIICNSGENYERILENMIHSF